VVCINYHFDPFVSLKCLKLMKAGLEAVGLEAAWLEAAGLEPHPRGGVQYRGAPGPRLRQVQGLLLQRRAALRRCLPVQAEGSRSAPAPRLQGFFEIYCKLSSTAAWDIKKTFRNTCLEYGSIGPVESHHCLCV